MPEKQKPLDHWKDQIKKGIRYRSVFGKSKDWRRFKNYYRGTFYQKNQIYVNIMYSYARAMIPQIYFRNPRVLVTGMKPGLTMQARVVERIDNQLIRELGLKEQMKSMALDSFLCGRGPGIIGYDTEYGYKPEFASDEFEDSSLTSFNKKGERIEYNYNVKPGMPWFIRCNPEDFIVPWGTQRWNEAQWFAFRKMRPIKDIIEDPKYPSAGKKGLKGVYTSNLVRPEQTPQADREIQKFQETEDMNWVELWQIHDQRSGRVFVLSLDHDKFLRNDFDYLQMEGLPARVLGFNEDPDFFWWTPDAKYIEPQQLEINDIRTMAAKHRRAGLIKILYDKGVLGKDELSKLLDPDVKAAVAVDSGQHMDIRKAVTLFQSHVPPDLYASARETREDMREIIGFSRNQLGAFEAPGGRRTAHEAEIVRAASQIRVDERRDTMADMLSSVVRAWNQLIFANWSTEKVIDVIGQDGARHWVRFTGKQIKGEFEFKVSPEESIPENKMTQKTEAEKFMELAAKIPGMNMQYLLESYASHFDWIDPKQLFPRPGKGNSPEQPIGFQEFAGMGQGGPGASRFPGLV
ncbi:hypothetical protein LCGC14_0619970 [marine sediment metagenome]|uniref:Uncharacterized protein n=1 Tax=marine sediment metagenome TaxID=412755 RepID=A0A0F9R540_9ZZZZ